MTEPRKRHPRGSDRAHNILLTTKVSALQLQLIRDVMPAGVSVSEWLRLAAVSAAYHERNRLLAEAACPTAKPTDD